MWRQSCPGKPGITAIPNEPELCQYLTQGSVRMVSIVGRGGMGKTALVSRVLADLERGALSLPGEKELAVEGILYLSLFSTVLCEL